MMFGKRLCWVNVTRTNFPSRFSPSYQFSQVASEVGHQRAAAGAHNGQGHVAHGVLVKEGAHKGLGRRQQAVPAVGPGNGSRGEAGEELVGGWWSRVLQCSVQPDTAVRVLERSTKTAVRPRKNALQMSRAHDKSSTEGASWANRGRAGISSRCRNIVLRTLSLSTALLASRLQLVPNSIQ